MRGEEPGQAIDPASSLVDNELAGRKSPNDILRKCVVMLLTSKAFQWVPFVQTVELNICVSGQKTLL